MKIPSSWKFIIGVVLILGGVWFGWKAYAAARLANFVAKPVKPGKINLVAITPGQGFRIIVANRVAQLAEVDGDSFGRTEDDPGNATNAKRLPIRELLKSLANDAESLGYLIERTNDITSDSIPAEAPVWKAEDIRAALDGDAALQKKLEGDLNVRMNGAPLPSISTRALLSGIIVELSVPVKVNIAGEIKTIHAPVRQPYTTKLGGEFEKHMNEKFAQTEDQIRSVYLTVALPFQNDPQKREDIRRSLEARINPTRVRDLAEKPEKVLTAATPLVNEEQITGASLSTEKLPNGDTQSTITLNLTNEGRMQLWKYSHQHPGFQLLFTVDGYAVAAPRITTDLASQTLTITRVPDPTLAKDTVDAINSLRGKKS